MNWCRVCGFCLQIGEKYDGRLLDFTDQYVVALIEEVLDSSLARSNDIVTVQFNDLSHVGYYDRSTTAPAPWGTLLIGGGGLLLLTLATNAKDADLEKISLCR